jgi:hypothetical protein
VGIAHAPFSGYRQTAKHETLGATRAFTFMQIARRMKQFAAAVAARVGDDERALLRDILTPNEQRLFARMPLFDQRHSLDVYHTLARAGHDETALLKAALLHDCGKVDDNGRPLPLVFYGIFVVLKRMVPALYTRAARSNHPLLRPFVVHAEHDIRSAHMVEMAGNPDVAMILRDYAARRMTPQTRALSWADNLN